MTYIAPAPTTEHILALRALRVAADLIVDAFNASHVPICREKAAAGATGCNCPGWTDGRRSGRK